MARPSTTPRWADVGGDIVEPSSGKKDKGWVAGELPPAQYFNWLLNLIYQWILWFTARVDQPTVVDPCGGYVTAAGWTISGSAEVTSSTNATSWLVPVEGRIGDKITSISARVKPGGATNTITLAVATIKDGVATAISGGVASTAGAAYETLTDAADPLAGHVIAAGESVVVSLTASGGGAGARKAGAITVTFNTP